MHRGPNSSSTTCAIMRLFSCFCHCFMANFHLRCVLPATMLTTCTLLSAVAFGLLATTEQSVNAAADDRASTELQYSIAEQDPPGSLVADLVADVGLRQTLDAVVVDALVFDVFHGPHSDLFGVDSPSGIVRIRQVVDRDVICYKRPTCIIPLDVAIVRPSTHFRV